MHGLLSKRGGAADDSQKTREGLASDSAQEEVFMRAIP